MIPRCLERNGISNERKANRAGVVERTYVMVSTKGDRKLHKVQCLMCWALWTTNGKVRAIEALKPASAAALADFTCSSAACLAKMLDR
jgi:hypothetical protein